MNTKLKTILNRDIEDNMAAIGFFSNYPVLDYFIEGDSALILGKSDHLWMHIISSSEEELAFLLGKYQSLTKYFYSVVDWMLPFLLKYGSFEWVMSTERYVLDVETQIAEPHSKCIRLDATYAPYIFSHSDYKDYISVAYAAERIEKDISAGIFIDNRLVAWGFTHDDGALGFVHVLNEYRSRSYGSDVLLSLMQRRRQANKPIFGNIVPENQASINMVGKLGMRLDRNVSWIKLK